MQSIDFDLLMSFVNGKLSPPEMKVIEAHLQQHPADQELVKGLRQIYENEQISQAGLEGHFAEATASFEVMLLHQKWRQTFAQLGKVPLQMIAGVVVLLIFMMIPMLLGEQGGVEDLTQIGPFDLADGMKVSP